MVDVAGILYGADSVVYRVGPMVTATLVLAESQESKTLTVRDMTKAKTERSVGGGTAQVQTLDPHVRVRMVELIAQGVTRELLGDSELTVNGRTWFVRSHELLGSPSGEGAGEIKLMLAEAGT